jgi:hypothetical protein
MANRVWTEGDYPLEIVVGSVWHVRFPPQHTIRKYKVMGLGERTVTLMEMPFSYRERVLDRKFVDFVERVSE